MKNLSKQGFIEEICDIDCQQIAFKPKKMVVIDFYRDGCLPCQQMMPILEALELKYEGDIDFYKHNIGEEYEIADFFNVVGLPTIMIISGQKKIQVAGLRTKEKLENSILKMMKPEDDEEI